VQCCYKVEGQKSLLVLQRVQDRVLVLWRRRGGGGIERRLLAVVKKQISADPTVRGEKQGVLYFFYPS